MRTLVIVVTTAMLAAVLGVMSLSAPAQAADRDCGDFATQKQAQEFFIAAGGPRRDPHRLDADGDGIACETLPCPCSTSTGGGGAQPVANVPAVQRARVVRVVDGDTVDVRLRSGARKRVRMVGIDTPEVLSRECGSARATRSLRKLAPRGLRVRLVRDSLQSNTDRYGRLLRYVVRARDTKDLNRAQLARGWAEVLVVGRGFDRERRYRAVQRSARTHHRGIWRLCR